jgi:hypothetical protein
VNLEKIPGVTTSVITLDVPERETPGKIVVDPGVSVMVTSEKPTDSLIRVRVLIETSVVKAPW